MTVDELQVLITGNTTKLQQSIDKAQSKISELSQTANKSSKSMTTAFLGANLIGKVISTGIKAITENLSSAISRLDTLNNYPNVMKNLGVATEDANASIEVLSEKLNGLPTTLNDAVSSVQRLTSTNGNVKASTEMFLALNNAILAGGATTQVQASALEQLSQAYAKGKPDMMEWRSAMSAMPAQLKQTAQAMGYVSADALGEDLRSGKVSMNEFMVALMKLNKEGINGLGSFEEQARNATNGVATSMTNVKTALTRGLTEIMNAIGQSNISGFFKNIANTINAVIPYITAFVKVCATAVSYISRIFGGTTKAVTTTSNTASNSLNSLGTAGTNASQGIDDATGSTKKLKKELQGLAGFDEMNVLKENNDSSGGTSTGAVGGVGALADLDLSSFDSSLGSTSSKVDEIYNKLMSLFEPLSKIDLTPLKNSFDNLGDAIKPVAKIISGALKTAYEKVLVPLGKFTIEKVLPNFFNLLASAIRVLTPVLNAFKVAGEWLLDNFLAPVAQFTGQVFISAIQGITNVLEGLANKINNSKTAQAILENIAKALLSMATALGIVKASMAIGSLIQTVITAFTTMYANVIAVTTAMTAMPVASNLCVASLTAMELIVGLLTGKLTLQQVATALATKAQLAFNVALTANPVGVVVAAVALLTAGLIALAYALQGGTKEEKAMAEAMKEKADAAEELNQKYKDYQKTQQDAINAGLAEVTHTQNLANELRRLADESGYVDEKNRARAEFILGELNEALGTEYTMVGNQIQGYKELADSIDKQIEKMKLQILFEARKAEYTEALTKVIETQKKKEEAKLELEKAIADFNERETRANAERVLEAQRQYDELNSAHTNMCNDIQYYEEAMVANLEGNSEKASYILQNKAKYFQTFDETVEKGAEEQTRILKEQQDKALENFRKYYEEYKKGNAEFSYEGLVEARNYAEKAIVEYEKVGKNMVEGVQNGIENNQASVEGSVNNLANEMKNTFTDNLDIHSPSRKFYGYGQNINEGIVNGLNSNKSKTQTTIGSIASGILSKFKNSLGIHSPSRVFKQMGVFIDEGLAEGIEDGSNLAIKSIDKLADDISMAEISPSLDLDKLNYNRNISINDTVSNQNTEIIDTLKEIADKEQTNVINVKIGEDTIINKIIDGVRAKNFETNGEVAFV